MFYLLFDDVLSVIYRCLGKGTQKYRDYWALFADKFLFLQTITNLINRKIPHSCGLKAQEKMLEFLDKNLK